MLRVNDLHKTYPTGDEALKGISMEVSGNEIVAIVGPSGAGKSTFIRCVNRLTEPTGGEIWLDDVELTSLGKKELRKARRDMGMIFQEFNLVERLTVMENLLSGRLGYASNWQALRRKFTGDDVQRAYEVLDRVGLGGFENDRADELSGGQRQRVGIARAVIQRPKILLVDEPTSSLDPETSRDVMDLLTDIATDDDVPVLINIHEIELALEYADRIVGLSNGKIVFEGAPDELDDEGRDVIYRGGESRADPAGGEAAGGRTADAETTGDETGSIATERRE